MHAGRHRRIFLVAEWLSRLNLSGMKLFQAVLRWRAAFTNAALLLIFLVAGTLSFAQMPDPPGQVKPGEAPKNEAYLFAHMMDGDYGRLYYSVSLDGCIGRCSMAANGSLRSITVTRTSAAVRMGVITSWAIEVMINPTSISGRRMI